MPGSRTSGSVKRLDNLVLRNKRPSRMPALEHPWSLTNLTPWLILDDARRHVAKAWPFAVRSRSLEPSILRGPRSLSEIGATISRFKPLFARLDGTSLDDTDLERIAWVGHKLE